MGFRLDRRYKSRADVATIEPSTWFAHMLPALVAERGALAAGAVARLELRPLHLVIGAYESGLCLHGDRLEIGVPDEPRSLRIEVSPAAFSDWVNWLATAQKLMVAGELRAGYADRWHVMGWELVLRCLTDGVAVHEPGSVTFRDRAGVPLDLHRTFTPADDPADIAHFLREAGYLHLRGWLDPADMAAISEDMDRAVGTYTPDDGRSWWATLATGEDTCVRMRYFVEHSPTTAALLASERWDAVRTVIAGDEELVRAPVDGNIIEALFKPIGVTAGISDVPWHRDCTFAGHPYDCAGVTVGISVTAGAEGTGMLRVVAGSHRASTADDPDWRGNDLPIVALPTEAGDITVHIACTIHEALPPTVAPRRVMYTGFGLPAREPAVYAGALPQRDLRNEAYKLVSQPANASRG